MTSSFEMQESSKEKVIQKLQLVTTAFSVTSRIYEKLSFATSPQCLKSAKIQTSLFLAQKFKHLEKIALYQK